LHAQRNRQVSAAYRGVRRHGDIVINWEAIGAIAETLGAVGVIITLVYLTVQLRQNTKTMQSATFQNLSDSMSDSARLATEKPDILRLMLKGESGEKFTTEKKAMFHFFAIMAMRRHETAFVQRQLKVVDPALMIGFEKSTLALFESGLWRSWSQESKHLFSDDFVVWIDRHIASGEVVETHFFMKKGDHGDA
jgi:hypothetical protein